MVKDDGAADGYRCAQPILRAGWRMNELNRFLSAALLGTRLVPFLILLGIPFSPINAEERRAAPPVPQRTIEVPPYDFDYEQTKPTLWRLDAQFHRYSLAYLILDPISGRERRAAVIVDGIAKPTKAFFLAGPKLEPVPEEKGRPLVQRIDRDMSERAELLITSGPLTIDFAGRAGGDQHVDIQFVPALKGFYEKFEDAPCLTLPDVMTLSRDGGTVAFAILIKNEGPNPDFDRRCGKFDEGLSPQMFSYVVGVRLRFAPTRTRIILRFRNYLLSIPYSLDRDAVDRAAFLVQEAQLKDVLAKFEGFPNGGGARPESASADAKRQAPAVQRLIDRALLDKLRKKGAP